MEELEEKCPNEFLTVFASALWYYKHQNISLHALCSHFYLMIIEKEENWQFDDVYDEKSRHHCIQKESSFTLYTSHLLFSPLIFFLLILSSPLSSFNMSPFSSHNSKTIMNIIVFWEEIRIASSTFY